jgi:hypothetical protein
MMNSIFPSKHDDWIHLSRRVKMENKKKLFRVKVVLFVMAENESAARVAATNSRFDIFECVARKADSVDSTWKDSIPYNADDHRTCSEILTSEQQVVHSETHVVGQPVSIETSLNIFDIANRYSQTG